VPTARGYWRNTHPIASPLWFDQSLEARNTQLKTRSPVVALPLPRPSAPRSLPLRTITSTRQTRGRGSRFEAQAAPALAVSRLSQRTASATQHLARRRAPSALRDTWPSVTGRGSRAMADTIEWLTAMFAQDSPGYVDDVVL
jgi:hypothetical protein